MASKPKPVKRCSKCGETKPLAEFGRRARSRDGYRSICKLCSRANVRQYYQDNREQILEHHRQYRQDNQEEIAEYQREWYQGNRRRLLRKQHQYHQDNREQILEHHRQYRQDNQEEIAEYQRQYRQDNREKLQKYDRQGYAQHGPSIGRQAYCSGCDTWFSHEDTWEWTHSTTQLGVHHDPASRGLAARPSKKHGIVWGWPPGGQKAAEREIRRLKRKNARPDPPEYGLQAV